MSLEIYEYTEGGEVKFHELKPGDVFKSKDVRNGNHQYSETEALTYVFMKTNRRKQALCLNNGKVCYTDENEDVIPYLGSLTIMKEEG